MGKIQLWNDSAILADNMVNAPSVYNILRHYAQPINVVVRADVSGTSEIFSTALWFFDPPGSRYLISNIGSLSKTLKRPFFCYHYLPLCLCASAAN